ncbi:phosphoinositide 3-kinase regulatory subunit 5 isoform X3 [Ornithorhynchus anatinus]|uniref:phosphoinositide 3-kinase regulatory subunit 5 isoform X3 n=1 Tax=Ornithorhynchus anatinus TaxID=9258 RepID=UPI0010A925D6|nr:phosphoinositide 3-kinase regulatory subunit 5 isoform X3 [Ornithorhynchus anatinus]
MQPQPQPPPTTCTEDRIQHALERCLHGLSVEPLSSSWSAGLCLNRWSLQELVGRDPDHFLILLEQILQKTRETPHFPEDSDLLLQAASIYHGFLTWPMPYSSVCRELLTVIEAERRAPGVSFQRLVRSEQGLVVNKHRSSTLTVLLLNPVEVQEEFLCVARQLSAPACSPHGAHVTLLQHVYQAAFGAGCDLAALGAALQAKTETELADIFADTTEAQEAASGSGDPAEARQWLSRRLQAIGERAGFPRIAEKAPARKLRTIPMPVARCYTYSWNQDSFEILNELLLQEGELLHIGDTKAEAVESEAEALEAEAEETDSCFLERDSRLSPDSAVSQDLRDAQTRETPSAPWGPRDFDSGLSSRALASFVSGLSDHTDSGYVEDSDESSPDRLGGLGAPGRFGDPGSSLRPARRLHRFCKLFKRPSPGLPLRRAGSLCSPLPPPARAQRSLSLPQHVLRAQLPARHRPAVPGYRRRPFLSSDEDPKGSTLRVVVFGSDRISGKVARAYSELRRQESSRPTLTRYFKLQFFHIPVKRSPLPGLPTPTCTDSCRLHGSGELTPPRPALEESTNNISHLLGALDPWYGCNVLDLLHLPVDVLCQQPRPPEVPERAPGGAPGRAAGRLPILADVLLYYCRFATRPVLLQLYQTELTFLGGETMTEIFLQSLELGHSAATRAIKASGPGSKRLGIDGDSEAVPLTLKVAYSTTAVSGRSRWTHLEKICTSVNLNKACRNQEELGCTTDSLTLTLTEVVKRQNSKCKKNCNQLSTMQVTVDKVQVIGSSNCPFAVCLDQDEQKILQSVISFPILCHTLEQELGPVRNPPAFSVSHLAARQDPGLLFSLQVLARGGELDWNQAFWTLLPSIRLCQDCFRVPSALQAASPLCGEDSRSLGTPRDETVPGRRSQTPTHARTHAKDETAWIQDQENVWRN